MQTLTLAQTEIPVDLPAISKINVPHAGHWVIALSIFVHASRPVIVSLWRAMAKKGHWLEAKVDHFDTRLAGIESAISELNATIRMFLKEGKQ